MSNALFSSSWHLVKDLTPRLRDHFDIHRHHYRDELWFILQDHSAQRSFRFTPTANYIFSLMNGSRTVNDIWHTANDKLGDEAPTQDEMIHLLGQLHAIDALQSNVTPDTAELLQRYKKNKQSKLRKQLLNPLSIKIPLFDPDSFLDKTLPFVKPLLGKFGLFIWLTFILIAIALTGLYWSDLTHNISDRILTPQNLLIIWLIFPIIKAFHELGHAYATKAWGGEVHEIGIMLLVFMPVPYVDASSASAFREKHRRMTVGAAGILVELFIASLALIVWVNIEPGIGRAIAYNVMLIAGISTLFFNGNPLLRFDGYYIFSDWLEIQNMATRANRYLGYLCQRYLFNLKNIEAPITAQGEPAWLVFYSIASFIYRMFIAFFIVLFVGGQFFFIGVLLAIWSVLLMVITPLAKTLSKVFVSPQIAPKRARAITVTMSIISTVLLTIFLAPVPSWTLAEGVVSIPENAIVRSNVDCLVQKIVAKPGDTVKQGEPLVQCRNIELLAQAANLNARLAELNATYVAQLQENIVEAEITREELKSTEADYDRIKKEINQLTIISEADGRFIVPYTQDLPGRFLRKGQEFAYILQPTKTVKVAIPQDDIDLVRQNTQNIQVRMAEDISNVDMAKVIRHVPAATKSLPSMALAEQGGGTIATIPGEQGEAEAHEKIFLVEIDFPELTQAHRVGGRVFVRFDHGHEPLGTQWYRSLRQLFLERFNV